MQHLQILAEDMLMPIHNSYISSMMFTASSVFGSFIEALLLHAYSKAVTESMHLPRCMGSQASSTHTVCQLLSACQALFL